MSCENNIKLEDVIPLFAFETTKPVKLKIGENNITDLLKIKNPQVFLDFSFDFFCSLWSIKSKANEKILYNLRYFVTPIPLGNKPFDLDKVEIMTENLFLDDLDEVKFALQMITSLFKIDEIDILKFENKPFNNFNEYEQILKKWRENND